MKQPRVYYMGKRVRDNEGRFSSFKIKVKIFFRKVFQLSMLGLALYVAFLSGRYIQPSESIITIIEAEDTLAGKIEGLKNEVVDTIRHCESRNIGEDKALITFDPDPRQPNKNIPSIGEFQYKALTVQSYYKALYGEEISLKQATLIALDTEKATKLTKDIIFKDTGKGHNNWFNCSKKHNIASKVEIIKSLEK